MGKCSRSILALRMGQRTETKWHRGREGGGDATGLIPLDPSFRAVVDVKEGGRGGQSVENSLTPGTAQTIKVLPGQ